MSSLPSTAVPVARAGCPVPARWQRVELKYALRDRDVPRIRRFVEPFVTGDPAAPGGVQRVTSLYLDTPCGEFYTRHVSYQADRFKLRVRRYGEAPPQLVYFEVKRKVGHVIDKRRAPVAAEHAVPFLTRGGLLPLEAATTECAHLGLFLWLQALHRAEPRMLVTCRRESFRGRDGAGDARVTIDRDLEHQPVSTATLHGDPRRWRRTPLAPCEAVLELKYSGAPPWWMRELAMRLGSSRIGYSKFVAAVAVASGAPGAGLDGLGILA